MYRPRSASMNKLGLAGPLLLILWFRPFLRQHAVFLWIGGGGVRQRQRGSTERRPRSPTLLQSAGLNLIVKTDRSFSRV